ncbi:MULTISPECIES: hypothetical protein [Salinibaculum]|uniref:hypothetical protein n=1 Tax=Salinibaculum TaxID=2732368 RepID=UPI0030D1A96C
MGITPIEGDGEHASETDASDGPRGIRVRLRGVASRLLDGVRSLVTFGEKGTAPESRDGSEPVGEIVVGDRRENLPATDSRRRAQRSPGGPSAPAEHPTVSTRREGDRFRIYDPDDPEAYVSSDEWMPVER